MDLYRNSARNFHEFSEKSFPWHYVERPALENILEEFYEVKARSNLKVLDAGCGSGRITRFLIESGFDKKNITGIDSSSEMLKIAAKETAGVKFILDDVRSDIQISPKDLIISVHLFAHLDQKGFKKAIRNLNTLLITGGRIIYLVGHPLRYSSLEKYFKRRWRKQQTPWGEIIEHYHRTIEDHVRVLKKAGFRVDLREPIVSEFGRNADPIKFLNYSKIPSRLLIVGEKD